MTSGTFKRDIQRFLAPPGPVALGRFHDGEYRILRGEPYKAGSGWSVSGPTWMRDRLLAALQADLPDFWIGISPPCDYPEGTAYFKPLLRTRLVTFATIFWHSNYGAFLAASRREPFSSACIVSSGKGDYRIPHNGVAEPWDLDGLVTSLLGERRPILLAAGPSAAIIAYEYWTRCNPDARQTILDVGSVLDPTVHGRATRHFQQPGSALRVHQCNWNVTVPWGRPKRRVARTWKDHLEIRAARQKKS